MVSGLTNGTPYTFTVDATNSVGFSVQSGATAPVIPDVVPGPPTAVVATGGNTTATVVVQCATLSPAAALSPPTRSLRRPPGGLTNWQSTSPITVTGLTNGVSYAFTVVATNGAGSSLASTPSAPVTPATVANAPTNVGGHA